MEGECYQWKVFDRCVSLSCLKNVGVHMEYGDGFIMVGAKLGHCEEYDRI